MGRHRLLREGREVRRPCPKPGCVLSKDHESWGIKCVIKTKSGYFVPWLKDKEKK